MSNKNKSNLSNNKKSRPYKLQQKLRASADSTDKPNPEQTAVTNEDEYANALKNTAECVNVKQISAIQGANDSANASSINASNEDKSKQNSTHEGANDSANRLDKVKLTPTKNENADNHNKKAAKKHTQNKAEARNRRKTVIVVVVAVVIIMTLAGIIIGLVVSGGNKYDELNVSFAELADSSTGRFIVPVVKGNISNGIVRFNRLFKTEDDLRLASNNEYIYLYAFTAAVGDINSLAVESSFGSTEQLKLGALTDYEAISDADGGIICYFTEEIVPAQTDSDGKVTIAEKIIIYVHITRTFVNADGATVYQYFKMYARTLNEEAKVLSLKENLTEIAEAIPFEPTR
ncbi:MAG: hypothetical protein PHX51_07450 [Clostridia bacterium]|nr:hypothetical protein [Clostridia bacterium]